MFVPEEAVIVLVFVQDPSPAFGPIETEITSYVEFGKRSTYIAQGYSNTNAITVLCRVRI
jgi:hypothetical protein